VDFLYKKDMFPGHTTSFQVTPTRIGDYAGKCAELCGEYHSMMLFNVKVVSQDEYDAYLESLEEKGNTGDITDAYDRLSNLPGKTGQTDTEEGEE
jgi:cytochrome c oxidase subunit 2